MSGYTKTSDGTLVYAAYSDGEYDLYTPDGQLTDADGDVVFLESHGGDRRVCRPSDGEVTTIERIGMNMNVKAIDGDVYYWSPATDGDLRRDEQTVVAEGQVDVQTVAPEEVTYESFDGTEIAVRLYRPEGDPVGGVVKAHGGPEAQYYNRLDVATQALVHAEFEVLARGSLGYGRAFRKAGDADLGGDGLMDVVAGASYLRDRGGEQVRLIGTSYGGYMALMGVGATDAFDMGASVCGVVNWETAFENARWYLGEVLMRKLEGTPEEKPDLYRERSPITYTNDIDVSLLIVQGANDPRVPQSEAEQLVSSLTDRDVDHEYLLFEDEGHGVERTENRIEYITRTVEFFRSHVWHPIQQKSIIMTSIEQTERTGHHREERRAGRDPTSNRPMSVTEIQASYAEYADWLHRFEWFDRLVTGRYRRARFGDVEGRALDVACGTGTNFRYLPEAVELVGIDISPEMLANAEDQLTKLGRDSTLKQMDAQDLEFADDSFDMVISALSTCTFPDPVVALQEMERVCKPEGTIRLVEHGRSDVEPIVRYQEWRADAHYAKTGCRWTQEPREIVSEAGLSIRDTTSGLFGMITTFEIDPR